MDLEVKDRVALVTGAGGGLGGAIAKALAGEGVRVAASDVDEESLAATVDEVRVNGGHAQPFPFDLADLEAVTESLDAVESTFGAVDIVVNVTGGPPPTPATGVSAEDWRRHFDALVVSVIHITDRLLPRMRTAGWGRIVTSTSSGVISPIPNLGLSNSLRSALVGWSKTLAGEVGADGITANIVAPGRIATPRIERLNEARAQREGRAPEDVSKESVATIPAGRYGRAEEYADVVAFLCSERASFVNGSVVRVDGGMITSI